MTLKIARRSVVPLAGAAVLAGRAALAANGPKTLNVGTGGAFTSIDPHYHNLTPNNIIANHLFSMLVNLDGNFKPIPGAGGELEAARRQGVGVQAAAGRGVQRRHAVHGRRRGVHVRADSRWW